MGRGVVPDGPRAVYAVVLAAVLVLSVVSPVLAASATGEQQADGELLDSPDNALALTETVSLTETLTETTDTVNDTTNDTVTETTDTVNDTTNDTVTETTDTVNDTTNDTVTETTDTVNDTTNDTTDTVNDTTETVNDTTENATSSVEETVDNTTGTVNETVNETAETVNETVNETIDDGLLTGSSSPQAANVVVENATAGEPVTVDVSAADTGTIGVSTMTIVPERDGGFVLNVTASNTKQADAPEFTRSDGGVDLGSIRVNHTISDENISNVTFTFSLSEERLQQANATPDEIALYRYHDGSWNTLNTTFLYEQNGSYVFRAESPGLSDFTAAAQKPEFELAKALLEPESLSVGDNVEIRVRIHNVGDADGSYTAKLLFNGELVATRQVTIAANGTRQVSFSRTADAPGTYEVQVNNASAGTLSVKASNATGTAGNDGETSSLTRGTAPGFGPLATLTALAVLLLVRRR